MEPSIAFPDKRLQPDDTMVRKVLGDAWPLWLALRKSVKSAYPHLYDEWKFPGSKYGWNYRIRDKKRVSIYFVPRENHFQVAFVFGEKATNAVLASKVSQRIKDDLASARVYAEGRGVRVDVKTNKDLENVQLLLHIKQTN